MANLELTSYQWDKILTFLRSRSDLYYVGCETDCRRFVAAVLWIARAGAHWRMLPAEYGKWNSIYRRYANWRHRGIWAALHQRLADDPDTEYLIIDSTIVRAHPDAAGAPKKGRPRRPGVRTQSRRFSTKVHITVDGLGNPLRFILTGGQENDIAQAEVLLSSYAGEYVIADKGYDARWLRECIAELGMMAVMPGRSNRGVTIVHDPDVYVERHLAERFTGKMKRYRRVFTRFEKLSRRYLGFWHFAAAPAKWDATHKTTAASSTLHSGFSAPAPPGTTCPRTTDTGILPAIASATGRKTALGSDSWTP